MRERNKLFHNCEHHQTRRTNATSHEVICKHSCKKTKFPVSVFYDGPCCKWVLKCHGCQSQPCDMEHGAYQKLRNARTEKATDQVAIHVSRLWCVLIQSSGLS